MFLLPVGMAHFVKPLSGRDLVVFQGRFDATSWHLVKIYRLHSEIDELWELFHEPAGDIRPQDWIAKVRESIIANLLKAWHR